MPGLVKMNTAIYCAPTSKWSATLRLVSAVTSIRVLEVQNYTQKPVLTFYRFSNFQTCFLFAFSFLFRIRLDSRPQLLKKRSEIVCFKSWLLFWVLSFGGDRLGGLGKYPLVKNFCYQLRLFILKRKETKSIWVYGERG